jgi:hypothetical protein
VEEQLGLSGHFGEAGIPGQASVRVGPENLEHRHVFASVEPRRRLEERGLPAPGHTTHGADPAREEVTDRGALLGCDPRAEARGREPVPDAIPHVVHEGVCVLGREPEHDDLGMPERRKEARR